MAAAYIEHRPLGSSEQTPTTHYVIVVNGEEVHGKFNTQEEAKDTACKKGYRPVHVARVRHLPDRRNPAHWREDRC